MKTSELQRSQDKEIDKEDVQHGLPGLGQQQCNYKGEKIQYHLMSLVGDALNITQVRVQQQRMDTKLNSLMTKISVAPKASNVPCLLVLSFKAGPKPNYNIVQLQKGLQNQLPTAKKCT